MNYEYARIDMLTALNCRIKGKDLEWLNTAPDVEYREDHLCYFVLKGSKTYTFLMMKYGIKLFD